MDCAGVLALFFCEALLHLLFAEKMMTMRDHASLAFLDLEVGDSFDLGYHVMDRGEIIEFASKYDPQPFHLDDEAARRHPFFTGLSASGWHSMLILQRKIGEYWEGSQVRGLAGAGVDDLRWHVPVYPNDRLDFRMTIEEIRVSQSKPDRGIIKIRAIATRDGEMVTTFAISGLFAVP